MDEQTRKLVTDVVDGDSLEAALRDYGPAAIEDLLPRLRSIAETLDAAHATGQAHGSLHPQNIFVSAESTHVTGLGAGTESPIRLPYTAPEMASGGPAVAASDQFALAAITFEWLFGRRISGAAVRPIEVRALPGVDRDAMARAFTRALAPEPANRYPSCTAFATALAASVIPVLPLGGVDDDDDTDDDQVDPVEEDAGADLVAAAVLHEPDVPMAEPAEIEVEIQPGDVASPPRQPPPVVEPVTSWQPSASSRPARTADRFSGTMLIVSCLVGMVVGFAAGYMAKPRALQSGPLASASGAVGASGRSGASGAAGGPTGTEAALPPAPAAPAAPNAPVAPAATGRLLVRSTPSGASVAVNGVARGTTPLALRDLPLGAHTITVTRRSYVAEEHRVVLTAARPSRSLEIRLSQTVTAAAPRAATPVPASVGVLFVESRPPGAAVMIDGKPRGTTPLTVDAMAPGTYRVNLSLAGYQPFVTTVRVVAGTRTRAAASLSVQE